MIKLDQARRIYFVGIKGVAMAALAIWAKEAGKIVTGSDVAEEFPTDEELKKVRIDVHEGFDGVHLVAFKPDLVIYTGAHGGRDNPQVLEAIKRGIASVPHGKALGLAMEGRRQISVAGSHGKTTTSAMIATILTQAGLDPSYAIGCGSIRGLGAAGHAGKGNWFVAEADEYVTDPGHDATPRFLWQKPEVLVVTNIDYDHPDVYFDLEAVQQAFVALQRKSKLTIMNADDPASSVLASGENVETFGLSEKLSELKLQVAGVHNRLNAAAAAVVCERIGIAWDVIKQGLERFGGTKRRLEKLGEVRGARIYDDYAHHPKEIEATIAAIRTLHPKSRLIVVFQPHTYSRTKALLHDFSRALAQADIALVTDIYASARETQTEEGLARRLGGVYAPTRNDVSLWLAKELKAGDVIVFMGAGDIYQWARTMI
ncbi:MAG: cyanophycin synthetase [Patescibacteria group bacterium]